MLKESENIMGSFSFVGRWILVLKIRRFIQGKMSIYAYFHSDNYNLIFNGNILVRKFAIWKL